MQTKPITECMKWFPAQDLSAYNYVAVQGKAGVPERFWKVRLLDSTYICDYNNLHYYLNHPLYRVYKLDHPKRK